MLVAPTREQGSLVIGHDRVGRLVTAVANSNQSKVFKVMQIRDVEMLRQTLTAYFWELSLGGVHLDTKP